MKFRDYLLIFTYGLILHNYFTQVEKEINDGKAKDGFILNEFFCFQIKLNYVINVCFYLIEYLRQKKIFREFGI